MFDIGGQNSRGLLLLGGASCCSRSFRLFDVAMDSPKSEQLHSVNVDSAVQVSQLDFVHCQGVGMRSNVSIPIHSFSYFELFLYKIIQKH